MRQRKSFNYSRLMAVAHKLVQIFLKFIGHFLTLNITYQTRINHFAPKMTDCDVGFLDS